MARPSRSQYPVARLRRMLGMRQVDFAKLLDITPDHLAQIEGGRSVSEWLVGQIARRCGALVPQGEQKDSGDQMPRAVVSGKPMKYSSQLPLYSSKHYEAWTQRVAVVRLGIRRWPLRGRWKDLLGALRAIEDAVGDNLSGQPTIEFPVKGANRADMRTRLNTALANAKELQLLDMPRDDTSKPPDLVVGTAGRTEPLLYIELKQASALTSGPPESERLWQELANWVKRPGRPVSVSAGTVGTEAGKAKGRAAK